MNSLLDPLGTFLSLVSYDGSNTVSFSILTKLTRQRLHLSVIYNEHNNISLENGKNFKIKYKRKSIISM